MKKEDVEIGPDDIVEIKDIKEGKKKGKVRIRGWMENQRSSGGIQFLILRDRTGRIQCTLEENDVNKKLFEEMDDIQPESVLAIEGEAKKDDRAPGGYEISADEIVIISKSLPDWPIAKKEHGLEFLLDNRHLWLRSEQMQAMLKIRSKVINIARRWLLDHGYYEFQSPIFISAACEGGSTLFPVEYFGKDAYLTQSWQLYAESAISSIGKIFTVAPSFRAEKSRTRRHLTEFWHLEVEEPFCDLEGTMKMQEEFVSHIANTLAKEMPEELKKFGRDPEVLMNVKPPFKKITYDKAIEIINKEGGDVEWGDDLTWTDEKILTEKHKVPFFVYKYPKGVKAFYHKPDPENSKVTLSADLLAPEGYGELIGGGQRTHDYDQMMKRIDEDGLNPEDYEWYIDLRRWGTVPHSGFGMGIERLIMWLLKLDHIRDAIAFPRTMTRARP